MRLEHHLVGGYVRYISPYIIIIIKMHRWGRALFDDVFDILTLCVSDESHDREYGDGCKETRQTVGDGDAERIPNKHRNQITG